MLDRVKAALFSTLSSRYGQPPYLTGLRVLDLFAGTGSLGLEALSRRAAECCFVENDARVVRFLRENVATFGLQDRSTIRGADAFARGFAPAGLEARFDVAFVDPPFRTSHDAAPDSPLGKLLANAGTWMTAGGIVVLHQEGGARPEMQYGCLRQVDRRQYGRQALTFYEAASTSPEV